MKINPDWQMMNLVMWWAIKLLTQTSNYNNMYTSSINSLVDDAGSNSVIVQFYAPLIC